MNVPQKHGNELLGLLPAFVSFLILLIGSAAQYFEWTWFVMRAWVAPVWFLMAFLPVGLPVIREAVEEIFKKDFFNEFTLMLLACIGAFCIGEYPEAVGVMLFYFVGEFLQDRAVDRATRNISDLLDVRGECAHVVRNGMVVDADPQSVAVGDILEVRPGERVPLDGVLLEGTAAFDTSALTGESVPRDLGPDDEVLAGMISLQRSVRLRVSKVYGQSALSRILDMVNNASSNKAETELFIRKFSRMYTAAVIAMALMISLLPAVIAWLDDDFYYETSVWVYRALVFLVVSCPCALVISVPLGFFAGIGAASRMGILFKGSNHLETMTQLTAVAFDKTGTLTTGTFRVEHVECVDPDATEMLGLMAAAESMSSHPLAKALVSYVRESEIPVVTPQSMWERTGSGAYAYVDGREVVAGNLKLMREEGVECPAHLSELEGTLIVCAVDGVYMGCVTLGDTVKEDAAEAIAGLRERGIQDIMMLSGDRKEIVAQYAKRLGITKAYGEMLPQDKATFVARIARTPGRQIAFVGDGMNDAPVLALSNVGIAMGGLGSDAAIESADVVIQTDEPSRIVKAIDIACYTHSIVWKNITFAIMVKFIVLFLGIFGCASLWGAVFADVGVALLAVLNSMRIMWRKY